MGPATMRSAAPLLSRSAVRRRAAPGASPDGGSIRVTPVTRPRSVACVPRRAGNGAVAREHEEIERRLAARLHDRKGHGLTVRRGQRFRTKAAAAQADENVHGARLVQEYGVGNALTVHVGPYESARSADAGKRIARREGSVAVVTENYRSAVTRRQHEIEIAVGVDVRRPEAGGRPAKERRRQLGRGRDVGEAARIRLSQQAETTRTRNREIRTEVVVQIGGDDGVGRGRAGPLSAGHADVTRPAGEANASCASDADNRIAIAGQRTAPIQRRRTSFRNRRQRERQRLVGRCRRRVRILQAHEAHQRLADFRARRADLGKRRPVHRLAQENVLQERDLRGRRSRVGGRRRQQRFQLLLCIGRP